MEIVPFNVSEDLAYNEVYTFIFTSDTRPFSRMQDCYYTKITIDGLNDDLMINESCNCDGFMYKKNCKHLKEAKRLLSRYKINFRK